MALTKETLIDRREVLADGTVQVRTATIIKDDGAVVSRTFHRHVVHPGDDLAGEDDAVKRIAGVEHTPEKIAAHQAKRAAQEDEMSAKP